MDWKKEIEDTFPHIVYLNYAHDLRGRIIHNIAEMEQNIELYICEYFTSDIEKRRELREIVLATKHIDFSGKADIFRCIVEKTGHANKKEATILWRHLMEKIAPKRNILAHCQLDTSLQARNKFIASGRKTAYFLKYANERKVIEFERKDVIEILELTATISSFIILTKSKYFKLF